MIVPGCAKLVQMRDESSPPTQHRLARLYIPFFQFHSIHFFAVVAVAVELVKVVQ